MSENERIISTLSPLGIPVEPDMYTGKKTVYVVFNYNSLGAQYGDDFPYAERHLIQIHLFAPHANHNTISLRKRIKALMLLADFTYSGTINASDEDGQHFVFEFEDAEGVDLSG